MRRWGTLAGGCTIPDGVCAIHISPSEVVRIAFIRRFLGRGRAWVDGEPPPDGRPAENVAGAEPEPEPEPEAPPELEPVADMTCPNCGVLVSPAPTHTRLCPRCRHRIVVRKLHGRVVYLAESSVAIFEAERERERLERTWTTQRRRWLELARLVRAPDDRRRILAAAPLSAATVASSRALYMSTADAAVRAARSAKDWDEVSRIRREQAVALAAEVGNSVPPIEEAVELHREAMAATLRALAKVTRRAELVGASCCAPCRADYGRSFRITDELRTPRLPHEGCPHGLCACDWWPVLSTEPKGKRRRKAGTPGTALDSPAVEGQEPADETPVPDDVVADDVAAEPVDDLAGETA